jgi:hypothetical protein
VSVLSDGQDAAIVLLRWSWVVIIVAVVLAIGVFVSLDVGDMMLGRCGKLLKKMMHPVRRGRGEKKPKPGGEAQVHAALEFRDWCSGFHLQLRALS